MKALRILFGFFRDRLHGFDELVEGFLRFGFGRLDHQRAFHDQWEVNGRRMEPVIDQHLGDVEGFDAVLELLLIVEHAFVQAGAGVGQVVIVF